MGAVARIAYGRGHIPLNLDVGPAQWRVIVPQHEPEIADPRAGFISASRAPIGSPPLREVVKPGDRVVIVTSDGTRAVPNSQLIPWILEELPVPDEQVTILLGTGTHRPNSPAEIEAMFGADITRRVRIVNHNCFDSATNTRLGRTASGAVIDVDSLYVGADRRIVVGFIEPHFFAGFSGGAKGVIPGVAGLDSILHLHSHDMIGHPMSAFGVLEGNPIQAEIAEMISLCPPDFLVNVTLNGEKRISGFYLGHYKDAHRAGCARVRETSMVAVERPFPIVITSNSGFPLDQNLYQTIKGLSAAARIVEPGGIIYLVSECSDGIPAHGNFGSLLAASDSPRAMLHQLKTAGETVLDQWQAQILASIQMRCEVALHSRLDPSSLAICKLPAIDDLEGAVRERIKSIGPGARVAVLPDGPLTIPYVAD